MFFVFNDPFLLSGLRPACRASADADYYLDDWFDFGVVSAAADYHCRGCFSFSVNCCV